MTPYVQDADFTLYVGDVREVLAELSNESVQCVVTSPPYWGLRDYGHEEQIGLEPTPELYVENMADVFREVRRVLRKDGTLWLNIGDSYATVVSVRPFKPHPEPRREGPYRLKPKDLCGIPWRLAFALQAAGWHLRSEIIWLKPNQMPESVTDRPTKAHEQVFLLTRSARYFYDADAVQEESLQPNGQARLTAQHKAAILGHTSSPTSTLGTNQGDSRRNLRSVWEIPTEPFPEAHFATYPQTLVERCVKAGSAEGDVVLDPFGGSGTTALVARRLGQQSLLAEPAA